MAYNQNDIFDERNVISYRPNIEYTKKKDSTSKTSATNNEEVTLTDLLSIGQNVYFYDNVNTLLNRIELILDNINNSTNDKVTTEYINSSETVKQTIYNTNIGNITGTINVDLVYLLNKVKADLTEVSTLVKSINFESKVTVDEIEKINTKNSNLIKEMIGTDKESKINYAAIKIDSNITIRLNAYIEDIKVLLGKIETAGIFKTLKADTQNDGVKNILLSSFDDKVNASISNNINLALIENNYMLNNAIVGVYNKRDDLINLIHSYGYISNIDDTYADVLNDKFVSATNSIEEGLINLFKTLTLDIMYKDEYLQTAIAKEKLRRLYSTISNQT